LRQIALKKERGLRACRIGQCQVLLRLVVAAQRIEQPAAPEMQAGIERRHYKRLVDFAQRRSTIPSSPGVCVPATEQRIRRCQFDGAS
jgi:hypothetical protein